MPEPIGDRLRAMLATTPLDLRVASALAHEAMVLGVEGPWSYEEDQLLEALIEKILDEGGHNELYSFGP